MDFALGYIAGMITATLIVTILAYFRRPIVKILTTAEKQLATISPRAKGFIVEPQEEAAVARQAIIDKNRAQGRDTKVSELI